MRSPVVPLKAVRERLRPGAHHGRHAHRRSPIAVVPPDPVTPGEVVARGPDGRLDAVHVEEPVTRATTARGAGDAVDRLNEAAAVARRDVRVPVQHPKDGVGFVNRVLLLHDDLGPVVAGDGQGDVALILAGSDPAARGRRGAEHQGGRQDAGWDHFFPFPCCLPRFSFLPLRMRRSQFFANLSPLPPLTRSMPPPQLTRSLSPPRTSMTSFPASALIASSPARGLITSSPGVPSMASGSWLPTIWRPRAGVHLLRSRATQTERASLGMSL